MSCNRFDRRGFIRRTAGLAAAGLAAPYIFTESSSAAPGQKLRVAAIGVGGRGSEIARQAGLLGQIVAVCDVDRTKAQAFADKHAKGAPIYRDFRDVLRRSDVDVVTIGTPDHWHVAIAMAAMKAGKDVYCEKPLTLTVEEGKLVCQAVKQTGRVFQVGTQQRSEYKEAFLKAVVIARSGRLGKKLHAVSSVGKAASRSADKDKPFGPFKIQDPPASLDWDLWLGQAPKVPYCLERTGWNFRWWFEYSGGQVTDWGVHHTDIAFWALAGDEGQAVSAQGQGQFMAVPREHVRDFLLGKRSASDMSPAYNVVHEFDVDIELTTGNTIKLVSGPNELVIEGENGRIRVNRGGLKGKIAEDIAASASDTKWLEDEVVKLYRGKKPVPHMANFFQCVASRELPISDVFSHVRAVNACHLANIAMVLNRKIRWDPSAQRFIGDDEANRLCARKQRSPYTIGELAG